MIRNPDGSEYKTLGTVQQYGNSASQLKLNDFWDQQIIMQGGSPMYYYEVFIPPAVIDKTYIEARSKLFSPKPVQLWCSYEPIASENFITALGWDSPGDVVFDLNAKAVIQAIGHMPKIGSRVFTPHLAENWEIVQRNLGGFMLWGAMRVQLICKKFTEKLTTADGRVTQNNP